jgi:hypothetical protein
MPNPETHAGGDGNTRIQRVFRFLKEYDELRNPAVRRIDDHPWHFWLDDLPDHPSVELRQIGLTKAADDEDGPPPSVLLRVGKPQMTTAPTPPPELDGWLTAGWQDPRNECKVLRSRNTVDRLGETVTVQFEDSPARVEAFALWCRKHADWRDAERPTIEARKVFETLHALRGRMERESDSTDLVIGDGLFSWKLPDNEVYHPLVLRRVRLEFNAELPEFWIVAADENCELCTTLFQGIPEADPDMLAARRLEVEKGACPPQG